VGKNTLRIYTPWRNRKKEKQRRRRIQDEASGTGREPGLSCRGKQRTARENAALFLTSFWKKKKTGKASYRKGKSGGLEKEGEESNFRRRPKEEHERGSHGTRPSSPGTKL